MISLNIAHTKIIKNYLKKKKKFKTSRVAKVMKSKFSF